MLGDEISIAEKSLYIYIYCSVQFNPHRKDQSDIAHEQFL